MTKQNVIRVLSGLMFLIFFCPFFQMCSDESLPFPKTAIDPTEDASLLKNAEDGIIMTGYELGMQIFTLTSDDLKDNVFTQSPFYIYLCFTLTLALSALVFILAMSGKFKKAGVTAGAILLLNLIALTIASVEQIFTDISQIKFGYYLFVANLVAIIALCAKTKIKTLRDGIDW